MSARATRPRSRRGRHAPPGELDPVAESSEEVEAASGSSKLSFAQPPVSSGLEQLGPMEEVSGQGLGSRTDKKTDGGSGRGLASAPEVPQKPAVEAYQAPEAALQYKETVPPGIGAPDVFQTLQHALSSLEAAAAAWRHRPPSHPGPMGLEDTSKGGPGPLGKQEGAGSSQREAARLAERNAWLRLALSSREDELVRTQASLEAIRAEKETLQKEVQELQNSLLRLKPFPRLSHSQAGGSGSGSSSSEADREPWETQDSFSLAHPLLRRLRSHSSTQILGSLPTQPLSPEMHIMEAQMEQLRGSIEKLKCFNRLLSAVLQGYKGHCEALSMQLGQREAEATALHLALQYSEHCEEAYRVLLALWEANSEAGEEAPMGDLQAAEEEAWRLLAQEEATMDAGARQNPQPSPEGSSVDKPTPQEVAFQLRSYVQRLQERRSLVKILSESGPTLAPMPTVPRAEAMVQAILGTQAGPALPRLEKTQIQQDLVATRGLPAVPGGTSGIDGGQVGRAWDPEKLAQELAASLTRTLDLREQLQSLRRELERVAQKGRARRSQSAELNRDLCKAHSALVLAFRGAHRKQEEQCRKLEQQMAVMEAQQAEEVAVLEATARALGKPRPPLPPPQLGDTIL
ncbi:PREDICTED: Usher syndrome type-1C protein-binding protein 1 [Colobus angolensis palliatus]|uniref:Harmonin-binding protein USHBP1 PDZ-binding domain-containing protein n=1 Tax=Colobus angolensis palliatus TaxID=336983 RepID=A0A2K5HX74_COLAP|nr:PREDICTED: Usher syndrome type-1C protein-binding protein 1 [Colobus angolensis palliatus]